MGDETLLATAAVFSGDQHFDGEFSQFVSQEDEFGAASADDADDLVAGFGQSFGQRVEDRGADPAADAGNPAPAGDLRRAAEGAGQIAEGGPGWHGHQAAGGIADRLDKEGDGSLADVGIGDGQGNAFGLLVGVNNDKLAGLAGSGDAWGLYQQPVKVGGDKIVADDGKHEALPSRWR